MRGGHSTRCTKLLRKHARVTDYLNGLMSEMATGLTAYGVVTDPPAVCLAEAKAIRSGEISLCLHPTLFFGQNVKRHELARTAGSKSLGLTGSIDSRRRT